VYRSLVEVYVAVKPSAPTGSLAVLITAEACPLTTGTFGHWLP
jgi:hypothetical protein